jgi:hypothetical protein
MAPKSKDQTPARSPYLTAASERVLRSMVEDGDDLVVEGFAVWVGARRTSRSVVVALEKNGLIKRLSMPGTAGEYFTVTPDAKPILADPLYEPRWAEFLRTGQPVAR